MQNVWMPTMDHSSFVRLKIAGLSTLGVMLISAMPDEPVFVYLGFRCAVTLVRPSCICLQTVKPLLCIMRPSPPDAPAPIVPPAPCPAPPH